MNRNNERAVSEPEGPAPDAALADSVERQIESRASGRVWGLRVACADGRVVLQGRCRTHHAKQVVQQAALDALGVGGRPVVVNQIVVDSLMD